MGFLGGRGGFPLEGRSGIAGAVTLAAVVGEESPCISFCMTPIMSFMTIERSAKVGRSSGLEKGYSSGVVLR